MSYIFYVAKNFLYDPFLCEEGKAELEQHVK
jgi:hypothetical protein